MHGGLGQAACEGTASASPATARRGCARTTQTHAFLVKERRRPCRGWPQVCAEAERYTGGCRGGRTTLKGPREVAMSALFTSHRRSSTTRRRRSSNCSSAHSCCTAGAAASSAHARCDNPQRVSHPSIHMRTPPKQLARAAGSAPHAARHCSHFYQTWSRSGVIRSKPCMQMSMKVLPVCAHACTHVRDSKMGGAAGVGGGGPNHCARGRRPSPRCGRRRQSA